MIKYILILSALYGAPLNFNDDDCHEHFTIYLVRHAEKNLSSTNSSDPELTPCGEQRAEGLKVFFSSIEIEKVYSTTALRAKSTAQPTATSKGVEVVEYNSDNLEDFAKQLLQKKENALVVGHNHTTAVLAGLLVGQNLGDIPLDEYDRIYQVAFVRKKGHLCLFRSPFQCIEVK